MVRAYPQQNPLAFFSAFSLHSRNLGLAAASTLALMYIMSQLIATDFVEPSAEPPPRVESVVMPTIELTNRKKEPPQPPQPVPAQTVVNPPAVDTETPRITTTIAPPVADEEFVISRSREPVAVYKPQPRYPRRALIQGIEGYVVVEFTITKTGAVRDVRAIAGYDSAGNQTSIFNKSAVSAAAKFKYQPPLAEGEPVERHGVRNRITYKMAD